MYIRSITTILSLLVIRSLTVLLNAEDFPGKERTLIWLLTSISIYEEATHEQKRSKYLHDFPRQLCP